MESVPGAVSYAGAEAEGRKTVVSRGVAGRGSVATGPAGALDRGKGRGVTVAQSPAQLAHAAAHRDAREPGQGRVTSVGGSPKGSGTSGSRSDCIIPGCRFTSGGGHKRHAVNAHLPKLFGEISSSTSLPDGQMAQLLELVQFIASTAIGCSVEALQRFWRCSGLEARPVLPTVTPLVRGLEAYAGWQSPDEYWHCTPVAMECRLVPCGYYGRKLTGQVPQMATFHLGSRPGDGGGHTNLEGSGRGWVVGLGLGSSFGGGFCLCRGFCRGGGSRLGPNCAIRYGH